MTPAQVIADLRMMGPQDLIVVLNFLADQIAEARLNNGAQLRDAGDVIAWLQELGEAARIPTRVEALRQMRAPRPQPRWDPCPRCGHVHRGDHECGEEMGPGRICPCTMEAVSA